MLDQVRLQPWMCLGYLGELGPLHKLGCNLLMYTYMSVVTQVGTESDNTLPFRKKTSEGSWKTMFAKKVGSVDHQFRGPEGNTSAGRGGIPLGDGSRSEPEAQSCEAGDRGIHLSKTAMFAATNTNIICMCIYIYIMLFLFCL